VEVLRTYDSDARATAAVPRLAASPPPLADWMQVQLLHDPAVCQDCVDIRWPSLEAVDLTRSAEGKQAEGGAEIVNVQWIAGAVGYDVRANHCVRKSSPVFVRNSLPACASI
jgi:hypothetical protein